METERTYSSGYVGYAKTEKRLNIMFSLAVLYQIGYSLFS